MSAIRIRGESKKNRSITSVKEPFDARGSKRRIRKPCTEIIHVNLDIGQPYGVLVTVVDLVQFSKVSAGVLTGGVQGGYRP